MKRFHLVVALSVALAVVLIFVIRLKPPVDKKKDTFVKKPFLVRQTGESLPVLKDDLDYKNIIKAVDNSLAYFKKLPKDRKFHFGPDDYDTDHMISSLERFREIVKTSPSGDELARLIKEDFHVYKMSGKSDDEVLFTGYYEPTFKGSRKKSKTYDCPLYPVPDDLVRIDLSRFDDRYETEPVLYAMVDKDNEVVPYHTRAHINRLENFKAGAEPVLWLENRVDRFFLEVQGSGRVLLENGEEVRIHYASKNGHSYRSIGKYLIEKDEIDREDMSMQAIREWLKRNPDRMDEVLHHNPSFVFFKEGKGGPYGCLGVPVTPMRSIATDVSIYPKGALCFIETRIPEKNPSGSKAKLNDYSGFVLNQDTGGAINGHFRADLFFGSGPDAEYGAGHMKFGGDLYFLVGK